MFPQEEVQKSQHKPFYAKAFLLDGTGPTLPGNKLAADVKYLSPQPPTSWDNATPRDIGLHKETFRGIRANQ